MNSSGLKIEGKERLPVAAKPIAALDPF